MEVFIESPTVQLQWEAVNTSALECPDDVMYCVSYRCCNDSTWQLLLCTANTSIELQLNDTGCEGSNEVVFAIKVNESKRTSYVTVNLEKNTGMKSNYKGYYNNQFHVLNLQ